MIDDLSARIQLNQQTLAAKLKPRFDFIVCGSGSSGSVVARRLAENPDVSVLLLEAGGSDDLPEIMDPLRWPALRRSEQDWSFNASPNPRLNGRAIPMAMGRVLGGGSAINVMIWSRGHKSDWDHFFRTPMASSPRISRADLQAARLLTSVKGERPPQ